MNENIFEKKFIEEWEQKYDILESDEDEYQSIIKQLSIELQIQKTISKDTFIRILNWKSKRLKGIVRINQFNEVYKPVLESSIQEKDYHVKLSKLLTLHGLNTPTATTILHFIYPDIFPIIDVRTLGALFYFNLIEKKSKSVTNYWKFYEIIHSKQKVTGISIRKIDRALFAFHKVYLSNKEKIKHEVKLKINEPPAAQNILENFVFNHYKLSIEEFSKLLADRYITDVSQKEIFLRKSVWQKVRLNYIAGLVLNKNGIELFTPKDIRDVIRRELIPSLSDFNDVSLSSLILTQDVHRSAKFEYNNGYTCLEKIKRGKYKFVGFSEASFQL